MTLRTRINLIRCWEAQDNEELEETKHTVTILQVNVEHCVLACCGACFHHAHSVHFLLVHVQSSPPTVPLKQEKSEKKEKMPLHKRCYNSCVSCLRQNGCSSYSMVQQEGPEGLYYRDDFNDSSWSCRTGTSDEDGIWMNTSDQAGTIMACLVWLLLGTFSFFAMRVHVLYLVALIISSLQCIHQ